MWQLEAKFNFTERVYALRIVLLAFIFGVIISICLAFKLGFLVLILLLAIILLIFGIFCNSYKTWAIGLAILGMLGGNIIGSHAFKNFKSQSNLIGSLNNQSVVIRGQVVKIESAQKGIFVMAQLRETNNQIWPYAKTNICTYINTANELNIGSLLEMRGNFNISQGANLQCFGYLNNPVVLDVKLGPPHSFFNLLLKLRQSLHDTLSHNIREPFLSLAQGYILGDDKATAPELKSLLNRTSMTHIVAVSGFNIAILFLLTKRLFIFLHFSPRFAYGLSLLFNIIFITVAGNPASAIRAGIMLSLLLGAEQLERMGNFLNILLLAAFVMILINPLIVIYDVGFQLSFLASLGLFCKQIVKPKSEMLAQGTDSGIKSVFLETFWNSFFVMLLVSPILIWNGNSLSLKPLLANLPILPLVPFTTFLVITLLFVFSFAPSIAYLLGLLIEIIIKAQLAILKFIAPLDFLLLPVPKVSFLWIIFYYGFLIYGVHLQLRKTRAII